MDWRDGMENSFDRRIIRDVKGALICLDAENWWLLYNLGGNGYIFRSPSWHGKGNRSLSSLQQGSRPVRAGIKYWWIRKSPLIQ